MIDVLLFALVMGVLLILIWAIERLPDRLDQPARKHVPLPMPPVKPPRQPSELEALLDHMEASGADAEDIRELRKLIGEIK